MEASKSPLGDPSDAALLRSIQNQIDWSSRGPVASAIAQAIRAGAPTGASSGAGDELVRGLRSKGLCRAPIEISRPVCERVTGYFQDTPCYTAHVPAYSDGVARNVGEAAQGANYGSYRLDQSLAAPHMIEVALDPRVIDLVGGYLGCLPSLYSINTFWTFPSANAGLSHSFHRDEDDYRFAVVFVYWTDVEVGEGEFYIIEGTHDYRFVEQRVRRSPWQLIQRIRGRPMPRNAEDLRRLNGGNGYGYDVLYRRLFGRHIRCVEGRAGTAIAADTFALHRGALPRSGRRLCTWIRYGLYANEAYRIDKTEPAPASLVSGRIADDPTARYITRLVLDWKR